MEKKLERKIKKIEKKIEKGDVLEFIYDGNTIGSYEFTEWSLDAKTPLQWFRICMCFEVKLNGLDTNKVTIKFNGELI